MIREYFTITEMAPTKKCLNSVLNVKAVVATFNHKKALVGAFSVIVKTDCETDGSFTAQEQRQASDGPAPAVNGLDPGIDLLKTTDLQFAF